MKRNYVILYNALGSNSWVQTTAQYASSRKEAIEQAYPPGMPRPLGKYQAVPARYWRPDEYTV